MTIGPSSCEIAASFQAPCRPEDLNVSLKFLVQSCFDASDACEKDQTQDCYETTELLINAVAARLTEFDHRPLHDSGVSAAQSRFNPKTLCHCTDKINHPP